MQGLLKTQSEIYPAFVEVFHALQVISSSRLLSSVFGCYECFNRGAKSLNIQYLLRASRGAPGRRDVKESLKVTTSEHQH